LIVIAYFFLLLLIANIFEPRDYLEIFILMYAPVIVGLSRWLQGAPKVLFPTAEHTWMGLLDRYAGLMAIGVLLVLAPLVNFLGQLN